MRVRLFPLEIFDSERRAVSRDLGKQSFTTSDDFGRWLQNEEQFVTQQLNSVSEVQGIGHDPRNSMRERLAKIKADFERAKDN